MRAPARIECGASERSRSASGVRLHRPSEPQQASQPAFVDLRLGGELCRRARPVGEHVSHADLGRDADRLRHDAARNHLEHLKGQVWSHSGHDSIDG
jgi:hypothetical protein